MPLAQADALTAYRHGRAAMLGYPAPNRLAIGEQSEARCSIYNLTEHIRNGATLVQALRRCWPLPDEPPSV
jgi:hypothetical protein